MKPAPLVVAFFYGLGYFVFSADLRGRRETAGCTPPSPCARCGAQANTQKPEYWPVYSTLFCAAFYIFYSYNNTSFRQHTVLEYKYFPPLPLILFVAINEHSTVA